MIHQIQHREEAIKENEARLRAIVNTAAEGIITIDEQGQVESANPAAEEIFGFAEGGLAGRHFKSLLDESSIDIYDEKLGRYLESINRELADPTANATADATSSSVFGTLQMLQTAQELVGKRQDATAFPIELSLSQVRLGSRRLLTGIVRDITQRKAAEREIREFADVLEHRVEQRTAELQNTNEMLAVARDAALEASLAKDTFLANMSHELRNPLNAIIGFSEMLCEDAEDEGQDDLVADLLKIHSAGNHLLGLINDVLDIAKISAGTITFQHERFDVRRMLQGLVDMVGPLVDTKSNRLELDWADNLGEMLADEGRVRQVLVNLLSNASKFTDHGTITLHVERQSRDGVPWLAFRVTDTGIGMSDEQLGRLFQRFSQVSASMRLKQDGAGLGLALSRELCRLLGGDLTAESEQGQGSIFTAELPAERIEKPDEPAAPSAGPAQQLPAPPTDAPQRPVGDSTILVIDDEATVRDLMTRFLSKEGFKIVTAASGEEGLRTAKQINPAAITLDTVMPGIDGWGVLAALKADVATAHIPVVMVTMVDNRGQGFALGAADYLTKPVNWERLSTVLRQLQCDPHAAPVLVVDDDVNTRDLISRMLHHAGWKSVTAENGRVALKRMEEQRPSLILLDLSMPEMDGYEFLSELRRRDPSGAIPVVIITAADLTDEDRRRLNGSVQQIVGKGESFQSELAQVIRRQVRQHAEA
jgi:signal transduction histidine kinase/CheY-like chemotaxis protein